MEFVYWLLLFAVFVLVEIFTQGLTSIWMAGGALAALAAAFAGADFVVQVVLFLLISAVLLLFTRPFAKKYVNGRSIKTNVDSLVGKTGRVSETIDNRKPAGTVYINGLEWMARSEEGDVIVKDSIVTIEKIEGVKLIVRKTEGGDKNA
ncbi:NfeD family protein [Parasporobacterium paucivorans]|uniref:Membrane protein implicated in regulation of membrane protease activity n=1 Tax=Parasporobacterium paucivorans DSM 15970 TaxID=1122934 RepID=A0A1M6JR01_9FIRM|nr:NfeD family protein [Parasporobacterium paucivorans]SHJ49205.1 Membrane protein implicated in regulation of membrane protease activity [Parasporobacterium paucivorans DSM 15970]